MSTSRQISWNIAHDDDDPESDGTNEPTPNSPTIPSTTSLSHSGSHGSHNIGASSSQPYMHRKSMRNKPKTKSYHRTSQKVKSSRNEYRQQQQPNSFPHSYRNSEKKKHHKSVYNSDPNSSHSHSHSHPHRTSEKKKRSKENKRDHDDHHHHKRNHNNNNNHNHHNHTHNHDEIRNKISKNIQEKRHHIMEKDKRLPNRKKLVIIAVNDISLPSHAAFDFINCKVGLERKVVWKNYDVMVLIVPTNTPRKKKETMFQACQKAKKINPKLFICIIDIEASESAVFRTKCFNYGANMVTNDHHSLKQVLNIIGNKGFNGPGEYICPYCHMDDLTEDELWHHVPLYHVNDAQPGTIKCPICFEEKRRNYLLHLRNHHGPVIRGEMPPEYRDGILTHAFALVVVRRPTDNKFLVVQEASNSGFWLPGGRVEVGETLLEAAIRETKEEAGIDVDIKGVLKVEHSTYAFDDRKKAYNRMRVIFYAEPMDEKELPKSVPNFDSAGATFISVDELDDIELRADEPREWFNSLTSNFYYHSLDILSCWKHDHRSPDHPKKYYYAVDNASSANTSNRYSQEINKKDSMINGHSSNNNNEHQQQRTGDTPESDFTESESYSSPYSGILDNNKNTKVNKHSSVIKDEVDEYSEGEDNDDSHQIVDDDSDSDAELDHIEHRKNFQKSQHRRYTEKPMSTSNKKKGDKDRDQKRKISEPSPYHSKSQKFNHGQSLLQQTTKNNTKSKESKQKKSSGSKKSNNDNNEDSNKNNKKTMSPQSSSRKSTKPKISATKSKSEKMTSSSSTKIGSTPQIVNVASNQSSHSQTQQPPSMQPQPQPQVTYIYYTQQPQFGYNPMQPPSGYGHVPIPQSMYGQTQRQSLQFTTSPPNVAPTGLMKNNSAPHSDQHSVQIQQMQQQQGGIGMFQFQTTPAISPHFAPPQNVQNVHYVNQAQSVHMVSPQRNSGPPSHFYANNNHSQQHQPPHAMYQVAAPVLYTTPPPQLPQTNNSGGNKNGANNSNKNKNKNKNKNDDNIEIQNYHRQQPKPELKSASINSPKMNKVDTSQVFAPPLFNKKKSTRKLRDNTKSDSLMRKKKSHRRSLSNKLPSRVTVMTSSSASLSNNNNNKINRGHTITTPPPGPSFHDDINVESGNRLFNKNHHSK